MNKNGCIRIIFSKLNCEEISSIYLCCDRCGVFDIPENAEVITVCFSPDRKRCSECYMSDEEWASDEDNTHIMEWLSTIIDMRPAFPEYSVPRARLSSFDDWPKTHKKQTSEQLCEAGFFYTQKDDRVICFCCGGGLYKWEQEDEPWEQHALHHGECDYLQLMKGPEYVASIKKKFAVGESEIPDLTNLFLEE